MTKTKDEVISTINSLIEISKDGQEGFNAAAERVSDLETKNLFYHYSQQRGQFVSELQAAVRQLGGDPERSGSMAGAMHRGWINLKSAIMGNDEHAVLAECERGENSALTNYKSAIEKGLPATVSTVIRRQYDAMKQAHDRIRTLRDRTLGAKA